MFSSKPIVGVCLMALLAVAACGQKGPLTLPKEPAAQNRATLPQVLNPSTSASPSASPSVSSPAPSASAPKR